MDLETFVRTLKDKVCGPGDCRYALFLGAGCSVSSGIPAASDLVREWLPRLKKRKTGTEKDFKEWAKGRYKEIGFDGDDFAAIYGVVIKELFETEQERREAWEQICDGKDPAFGYRVLAQLIGNEQFGKRFDLVLTTNFDELIEDCLRVCCPRRPRVVNHDFLARFARESDGRPLVVKLHGDAHLAPKNTKEETKEFPKGIQKALGTLLHNKGIIFVGYGGNDDSVVGALKKIPHEDLPYGVYWVGSRIPVKIEPWLKNRKAIWVRHRDFDQLMDVIFSEFELTPPDRKRFDNIYTRFAETLTKTKVAAEEAPTSGDKAAKVRPLNEVVSTFKGWLEIEFNTVKYKRKHADKVDKIFRKELARFPDEATLINHYADFLYNIREDYDRAEEYYKRAEAADPNDAANLADYATFLYNTRKDYDRAEEYYKRAEAADPNDAYLLGRYANFLYEIREEYDRAEEYYKRAEAIRPNNVSLAYLLGSYANFLYEIREEYDRAEEYYKRAETAASYYTGYFTTYAHFLYSIRKDYNRAEVCLMRAVADYPNDAYVLGSYAVFLCNIRKYYNRAEKYFKRAETVDPDHIETLSCYANFLCDIRRDYDRAEEYFKRAEAISPNNAYLLGSYANFLYEIREEYDRAEEYFKRAETADPDHVETLSCYANFLCDIRRDYDRAEEYYKRAEAADPNHNHNLRDYAIFLCDIREDYDRAEEYYKKAEAADPDDTINLGTYAIFLQFTRKYYDRAEEYYKRVLTTHPKSKVILSYYAGLLLGTGRLDKGLGYLKKALSLATEEDELLECLSYQYAHADNKRAKALRRIKQLLGRGTRSPGWDLSLNVQRATADGHPEPAFLAALAEVIADEKPITVLDDFEVWRNIK